MPFDQLGTAFANVFVRQGTPSLDLNLTWYPNQGWGPIEVGSYVGLPLIVLAVASVRSVRARPFVVLAAFSILFPLVAGLRPSIWEAIPVWNSIHAPVRAYVLLDLALVVLAAMSIGRLQRGSLSWRPGAVAATALVGGYVIVLGLVFETPDFFVGLVRAYWGSTLPSQAEGVLTRARDILSQALPILWEIALAVGVIVLIRMKSLGKKRVWLIAAAVITPLLVLSPPFNQSLTASAFDHSGTALVSAVEAQRPNRVAPLKPPIFWPGMPNQLAVAGIADLDMISSLSLETTSELQRRLESDPSGDLARAMGIDVVMSFKSDCPGTFVASIATDGIKICHLDGALTSPYWLPDRAVVADVSGSSSLLKPAEATFRPADALALSKPATEIRWDASGDKLEIDAPSAGWVFISRAWWPGWQTTLDGVGVAPSRAFGGQLVHVSAGRHVISQTLTAWDAALGFVIGLVTLVVTGIWASGRIHLRRGRPRT
jgi:hypothetical protein